MYEFYKKKMMNAAKIICDAFGEAIVSIRTIKRWYTNFKRDNFDIEDKSRSGRPSTIDDDSICTVINANPRISIEEVAENLNVDKSSAYLRLRELRYVLKLDV
ncbi:Histone-lysine N-methyltransferase SETMAR [Ooceraea biroi]|uniref:Histone-lysine N-methyltransferase SETMAR n=1 Tax=Ooceraea biroi TaxID=2015173 RepID=A0A026W809_OOCBI|nr:Histone-lysine N-methyltransferase SETMAR [Ooceraea biroi]